MPDRRASGQPDRNPGPRERESRLISSVLQLEQRSSHSQAAAFVNGGPSPQALCQVPSISMSLKETGSPIILTVWLAPTLSLACQLVSTVHPGCARQRAGACSTVVLSACLLHAKHAHNSHGQGSVLSTSTLQGKLNQTSLTD